MTLPGVCTFRVDSNSIREILPKSLLHVCLLTGNLSNIGNLFTLTDYRAKCISFCCQRISFIQCFVTICHGVKRSDQVK